MILRFSFYRSSYYINQDYMFAIQNNYYFSVRTAEVIAGAGRAARRMSLVRLGDLGGNGVRGRR